MDKENYYRIQSAFDGNGVPAKIVQEPRSSEDLYRVTVETPYDLPAETVLDTLNSQGLLYDPSKSEVDVSVSSLKLTGVIPGTLEFADMTSQPGLSTTRSRQLGHAVIALKNPEDVEKLRALQEKIARRLGPSQFE
ncbi:MAG TPA: hypothetical protein VK983_03865 [Candidatus Limnocylindrales bacterium]|nr:hypothetical protein [Candidatus Limnocylindrales bacterium]